ncbi:YihY/virulence factor BrkB family protein [Aeromicrobium phragmitis]|uniref:YihY/virulence factor BrkB family protein n=1 Tax=Aeromicrobium phragmitis TaxID=2478914 RepID=A0A3L8PKG2_9ACTN|nr:YihY/virulence factor BrkB family protein [Aeromicrobium phragmitis]RLV55875.1 YihY/virulence factor BrkB family protein [Aeromicrobium phragmitis]
MRAFLRTVKLAWKQASSRQAPLLAAGVAFYSFTSLFPALIAGVSLYGLVASPQTVAQQSDRLRDLLPADAASLVTGQIEQLTATSSGTLGVTTVVALAVALWSASGGVGNLLTAVNLMFGLGDDRGFVKRKALALGMTVTAILFAIVAIALVAVVPAVLNVIDAVPGVRWGAEVARWLVLVILVMAVIAVTYRLAPNRPHPSRFISRGVVVASLLWLLVSVGFSMYVNSFGNYGKTYGALAGVVVLLLWLWIGLFAVLLGAALQAVDETVVTAATVAEDQAASLARTEQERAHAEIEEHLDAFLDDLRGRQEPDHR